MAQNNAYAWVPKRLHREYFFKLRQSLSTLTSVGQMAAARSNGDGLRSTVPALVTAHARARPDQLAVQYRDEHYTYAQLDARAGRIANALRARGVVEGDCIGVSLEPELDVPAALLAVLKLGAAYVPLDPQYPASRIAEIVADVRPRVIVSRSALRGRLGSPSDSSLLLLDSHEAIIASQSDSAPTLADDRDRIATIFFTSGTTGRPKGARASHAQLAFYAEAARMRLGLQATDVVPTIARFSFSISILELLVPLTAGATVQVLDRDVVMDPTRMASALERVTFFHMGPSLLRGVLAEIQRAGNVAARLGHIRHASSGGDMIPPQVLTAMRDAFPSAEVFVLYGCTEISCMGTCYEVPREGVIERTYVGEPFPEMTLRLVDEQGAPVVAGESGEVFFAGPGVIQGYLDRPELDAARFVMLDGMRFYRTGDIGRWHDGKGLELLGRADFQIKVRGMRVESAEVEYHLRRVPGVRDAAVALRARGGEDVLAAFVVRDPTHVDATDAEPLAARIRRALVERVPDYMVPSAIAELLALPLNQNLKLDRRALPALADAAAPTEQAFPPRSTRERWLAAIWCELLGRESVGRRDNFFELGGDSLLGLQFILRVERETGVRIEGIDVLRESLGTLAELCGEFEGDISGGGEALNAPTSRRESFYFGPDSSLYGIIEHPGVARGSTAVLICGPIGAEDIRPSFVLTLLMRRLAARGVPVMRFDWYGTRDSAGDGPDGDPARWRADLLAARDALTARTGAKSVTAIGIRLGGLVLLAGLKEACFDRVVMWDAVIDGRAFVARARAAEDARRRGYTPRLRFGQHRNKFGVEELHGFSWSTRALDVVSKLRLDERLPVSTARVSWLSSEDPTSARSLFEQLVPEAQRGEFAELSGGGLWADSQKLLDLMPDVFVVQSLMRLAEVI